MISVIGHELAELSSNPLVNAWYAGEDPTAPTEIGDLCEGLYGSGGGGGYIGAVMKDKEGRSYNLNGKNGRRFLVQWLWSPVLKACAGSESVWREVKVRTRIGRSANDDEIQCVGSIVISDLLWRRQLH